MKAWLILFSFIILTSGSIAIFLISTQSKPPVREVIFDTISPQTNLYTNKQFGFIFAIPQGYTINSQTGTNVELVGTTQVANASRILVEALSLQTSTKLQQLYALCRRLNVACKEVDRQVVVANTNGISGIKYYLLQSASPSAALSQEAVIGPVYVFDLPILEKDKAILLLYPAGDLKEASEIALQTLEAIVDSLRFIKPSPNLTPTPSVPPLSFFPEQTVGSRSAQ